MIFLATGHSGWHWMRNYESNKALSAKSASGGNKSGRAQVLWASRANELLSNKV
jgi:hypothetical protein